MRMHDSPLSFCLNRDEIEKSLISQKADYSNLYFYSISKE